MTGFVDSPIELQAAMVSVKKKGLNPARNNDSDLTLTANVHQQHTPYKDAKHLQVSSLASAVINKVI